MLINVQFNEASNLLWELFKELPEEKQNEFAQKVNSVACMLAHPCLDADVFVPITLDNAR